MAEKEIELRLLRLNSIKFNSKLKKMNIHPVIQVKTNSVKKEELSLENKVYCDKLEENEDKISRYIIVYPFYFIQTFVLSLRHCIAGDVVMLSHLAMKLYYVKMETENLCSEEEELNKRDL